MKVTFKREFVRNLKQLSKRHVSLRSDVDKLVASLKTDPLQGESLGNNRYKIRLNITSKGKGKSGGGRVITYVELLEDEVHLLTLYDKSDMENVNDAFLDDLVKDIE